MSKEPQKYLKFSEMSKLLDFLLWERSISVNGVSFGDSVVSFGDSGVSFGETLRHFAEFLRKLDILLNFLEN